MNTIERGKTKKIQVTFYDEDSDLVDPTTPTITITFQDGTAVITAAALTKVTTGVYIYRWATTSSSSIGIYNIEVNATFGTQSFVNRDQIYVTDIISGD